METRPFVLCIAGPTATGKTAAAVAVCKALSGEVISMDSMQIYEHMNIGTAKPSVQEMQGIAHHMLSFVPPDAAYSVADYQRDARQAMADVLQRNQLPVFAGGTGLYLQAVSHPLQFTQVGADPAIRMRLQAESEQEGGIERLHARLSEVDPVTASRLHPNNSRRVIRALEVYLSTGQPMSAQSGEWEADTPERWLIFALHWPREVLYERINRRVDLMVEAGLVQEVETLLDSGIPASVQAMKAIGYREIAASLCGQISLDTAIDTIKMNSRRYAKRQLTWLRREARAEWIDLSNYPSTLDFHDDIIARTRAQMEA